MARTSIPMVNLRDQYLRIKEEIDRAVLATIDSTKFINGPEVQQFEEAFSAYLGVRHVIGCANGTDALQVAFMALGLEEGDEVITPSFTYAATAEALALLKLTPVFVDVTPDTYTIDPNKIEQSITARTKAILPVHLFGATASMDRIMRIASKYGLHVVEDCAQSTGSVHKHSDGTLSKTGTIGTIGTFSFFPSKNLGCFGDGGAIVTNNDQLAERLRMVCRHGQRSKYVHEIIGCNSRLDTLQAAVLQVKLPLLDGFNSARQERAQLYRDLLAKLPQVTLPVHRPGGAHVYHQFTIQAMDREGLQEHLNEAGIATAVYYPVPLHQQRAFQTIPTRKGDLEVTESIKDSVLSLPIDTELSEEDQRFICETIIAYYSK